jgi:hypothetical protein
MKHNPTPLMQHSVQPSSFLVFLFTASRFPISYELIMIAQAGATFKHRAAQPLNNPGTPSVQ